MERILGYIKSDTLGTSLAIQWLRPYASEAEGQDLIPVQGTRILHATRPKKKKTF